MISNIRQDLQSFHPYPDIESLDTKMKLRHFIKAIFDIDFRVAKKSSICT